MRTFEFAVDPAHGVDLTAAVRRELQTLDVRRIARRADRVAVEVSDEVPPMSQVLAANVVAGLPFEEVWHHSAVLPRWLAMFRDGPAVYIVHVDSHDDLGSPNLVPSTGGGLCDRWTGAPVDPQDQASVRAAIDSSAIEIGSYLTLALYWLPVVGLALVFPAASQANIACARASAALTVEWAAGDALHHMVRRLRCTRATAGEGGVPAVRCEGARDLALLRDAIPPDARIVLDIDADFFDNSDDNDGKIAHGAAVDVAEFIKHLRVAVPSTQLALVSLSRSPGFCPSARAAEIALEVRAALTAST